MRRQVIILPQAEQDIERNALWWAEHHDRDEAARWVEMVFRKLERLAENAETYALAPENDQFDVEIRQLLLGVGSRPTHRAIYRIHGDRVEVLTIRSARQDVLSPDDVEAGEHD